SRCAWGGSFMLDAAVQRRHDLRTRRWCYRIARVRSAIGEFADALDADLCAAGVAAAPRRQLATVLDELLANVVMHARQGRGNVHVRLQYRDGRIVARLRYRTAPFDPTAHVSARSPAALADAAIGGAGIALVRALTQRFTYRYQRGENRVRVEVAT
ncbi:MAG: ATP-binding protein, partial [Dokdonella sp.]